MIPPEFEPLIAILAICVVVTVRMYFKHLAAMAQLQLAAATQRPQEDQRLRQEVDQLKQMVMDQALALEQFRTENRLLSSAASHVREVTRTL